MNTTKKRLILALTSVFFLALILAKTVGYDAYSLSIPSDFQNVGQLSVQIPLGSEVSGRIPHSSIHSKIYTNGESILFVQRMSAPGTNNYFKPLDGEKANKLGKEWYKNTYSMDVDNTTPEFSSYNNFLKEHSLLNHSNYLVEMYDQLVTSSSVFRLLIFTPNKSVSFPIGQTSTTRYYVKAKK